MSVASERWTTLPELTPTAELALLARTLHREGYDDHLSGHISYRQDDGTLLVTPTQLTWDELRASDIMRIDSEGSTVEGKWGVTPAILLHVEMHKLRHDIRVAVHNHSQWGTIWADLRQVPPIYDQTSAQIDGEIALVTEYEDNVANRDEAQRVAQAIGDAKWSLLANHGVVVVGENIRQAHLRCVTLEWRCRQAWRVAVGGGGVPMPVDAAAKYAALVEYYNYPGLFEAMARRELRLDPAVLD